MRRSRRFIKEHKLKPIANVDKEKREDKRGKGQRKYAWEREREREWKKWNWAQNKEKDRKKILRFLCLFLFLMRPSKKQKAGTSNKEKGQEHEKKMRIFSFPDKKILHQPMFTNSCSNKSYRGLKNKEINLKCTFQGYYCRKVVYEEIRQN